MFSNNEKLNEIYRDTWPNLGWAKRDMKDVFAGNYPGPLYARHPDLVMEEKQLTHEEMLEIAAQREQEVQQNIERAVELDKEIEEATRPFYRFFAIEYFATGEGMSFWLKVCRNYDLYNNIDYDLERFAKFIGEGAEHYMYGMTQPTEEQFMIQYSELIPRHVVKMIERKDQPALDWETHFHVNYS
jgi:hypothetical protein